MNNLCCFLKLYKFYLKDALRQEESPHGVKSQFMTILAPIYFVIFVLMAQFVLVNVVVAVLMKKLDVNNTRKYCYLSHLLLSLF